MNRGDARIAERIAHFFSPICPLRFCIVVLFGALILIRVASSSTPSILSDSGPMFRTLGKIVTVSLSLVVFSPAQPGTASTRSVEQPFGRDPAGSAESAARSIDSSGLLDSALDASRLGNLTELAELSKLCDQQATRLRVLVDPRSAPAVRGELVLRYLHEHLLHGVYAPRCEDVAHTLRSGDFNCVTATVLYVWLCREADLEVQVLSLPGHVYCRLAADPTVEIQTTSPRGFAAPPESACLAGSIADASTAIYGGESRVLSDRALIAKVYYNRGVTLLERSQFADAFAVLQTSVEMDEADPLISREPDRLLEQLGSGRMRPGPVRTGSPPAATRLAVGRRPSRAAGQRPARPQPVAEPTLP